MTHALADRTAPITTLPPGVFDRDVATVARGLIGVRLLVDGVGGLIVETEAYDVDDPAAHSFMGQTARNAPMFGPTGHAYVYRIYGLHWCLNVVCGRGRGGGAVLIRALEPTHGLEAMRARRGVEAATNLCSGPAKLCQALAVTGALQGADLARPPFALTLTESAHQVRTGRRIGISKGVDMPWRFGLEGSPWLSRRF